MPRRKLERQWFPSHQPKRSVLSQRHRALASGGLRWPAPRVMPSSPAVDSLRGSKGAASFEASIPARHRIRAPQGANPSRATPPSGARLGNLRVGSAEQESRTGRSSQQQCLSPDDALECLSFPPLKFLNLSRRDDNDPLDVLLSLVFPPEAPLEHHVSDSDN